MSHDEIEHGMTVEQLTEQLLETRERIAQLRDHERFLVDEIHHSADKRKTETKFGIVETSIRRNRRWDHDELVRHLTRVAIDRREIDPATGAIISGPTTITIPSNGTADEDPDGLAWDPTSPADNPTFLASSVGQTATTN